MKTMKFSIGKMRHCFVLIGVGSLLAGCQSESPEPEMPGIGTVDVQFQVSAPEELETRAGQAGNSRLGGLANVDFEKYDLRYQLAVYRVDGDRLVEAVTPQAQIVDAYEPVTYSLKLTPDRQYKVVVWADFVKQGETVDLHYNTADFRDITVADAVVNDESKDAFSISQDFVAGETVPPLTLKRPFAKLRIVTTDWNQSGLEMPDNFKVTYFGCTRFDHFDAATGVPVGEVLPDDGNIVYTGRIDKAQKEYTEDYDASEHNRTLVVDYLMTDSGQPSAVHFTFEALNGEVPVASYRFDTDIPIQRNWLTTVIGNTLTQEGSGMTVSVDREMNYNY